MNLWEGFDSSRIRKRSDGHMSYYEYDAILPIEKDIRAYMDRKSTLPVIYSWRAVGKNGKKIMLSGMEWEYKQYNLKKTL